MADDPFSKLETVQPQPAQATPQPAQEPTVSMSDPFSKYEPESQPESIQDKYKKVMDSDSSRNAQVMGMSDKMGISPQAVEKNFDSAKQAYQAPTPGEVDGIVNSDPALAKWAGNTPNLSAIHQDLSAHGKFVTAMRDMGKGVNEALAHVANFPNELTSLTPSLNNPFAHVNPIRDMFQENADIISSPELNQDAFAEAKKGNLIPLIGQVSAGIPNVATIGAMFAVNPVLGGEYVFSDTYATNLQNGLDAGLPGNTANLSALGKATIATGTMFIPMHYLSGIYKGISPEIGQVASREILKKALVNNIGGAVGMGSINAVNTLADAYIDKATGQNPHAMDGILDKMKGSALEGALTWGVIGGVPTLLMARRMPIGEQKPPEALALDMATKQKDNFLKAFDASQARKLTTDNPDMAKKQTKDYEKSMGFSDVHIPLQEFQTLYQDNAEEIAKQIGPETAKSYQMAKDGFSAHVKAPMSELLNTKAPIQQEALADHIKMSPDLPTVTEAKITKEEADVKRKEQETKDEQALAEFEKKTAEDIKALGGKVAEGATVTAKAKAYEIKNLAKILNKPVSTILQLARITLMREPKEDSFKETYDSTPGIATTKDFLERHGIKVLIEKPDESRLTGGALDEAKFKAASQKGDARNNEIPFAQDKNTKGARSLSVIAQSLFDAANEGEIDRTHLPKEWWDEGASGRPDFSSLDDLLELVRKGSGIESYQKMEQSSKEKGEEYQQKGIDPTGLSPKDEKEVFGNTVKSPKGQDQTMFQSVADSKLRGIQAAVIDSKGKMFTGYDHAEARSRAEALGEKEWTADRQGFRMPDGTFMGRDEAEAKFGFRTSESLHEMQGNQKRSLVYFQGHRGRIEISGAAGEPQGRDYHVFIESGGDKSTINHEFAHVFLQIFRDHVTQEDSPRGAKDMEKQLFKMFHVESWDEVNDRHSEIFARGWEWRLWEGKVPTAYTGIYNMFANWMRKIYPSTAVMEGYLNNVGVKMDEGTRNTMRKVYDRFIASSEEIEASEKIMGYNAEAPEGLTEEELQRWKDGQDKATQASIGTLIERKMALLKKDAISQIADERGRAQKNAEKEVDELPVFKAGEALRDLIKTDDPKGLAKKYLNQKTDDIESDAINHVAKEIGYSSPLDLAEALSNSDRNAEIKERIDAHMEQFKERVNAGPAEAQMATINEERKDSIAHQIATMEQYKEGTPPKEDLHEKSLQAISEAKGKMLGAEMEKAQAKPAVTSIKEAKPEMTKEEADLKRKVALQQYQRERAQARVDAQRELSRLPIKDSMNVKSFVADVKEATKRVKEFEDKGNTDKAQEWRRRQLKSMEMADMAKKTALEVMKKRNEMRRFSRIERKPLTMPNGHWLQIKSLLENSELKPPSKVQEKLHQQIAQNMKNDGEENDDIADATGYFFTKSGALVPENLDAFRERMMKTDPDLAGVLNVPEHMKMDNMTLRDFRNLTNAVKAVYKNGRDADNLEYSFGQVKKGIAVDQLKEALVNSTKDRGAFAESFQKNIENRFWPVFAQVTRVANILDGGDPHGPFNRLIINPLLDGLAKRDGEKIDLLTRLQKVKEEHYPNGEDKSHTKLMSIKTSQGMQNFSKNEIKQIYAWMGQPDAMTALTTGNKWTSQDLRAIVDHLDENDLKYMENVGKELSKDFPRLAKLQMDIDGVEPHKAETSPVETKFGIREGFYYPMKYKKGAWEAMMGWGRGIKDDISKTFQDRVSQNTYTKYGIQERNLMERTGVTGRALDTVNSPIARYVEDSSRYLGLQSATKQVGKILNDKKMMEALKEHVGPGAAILKDMVEYVAGSQNDESTAIDKLFAVPRQLFFAHKIGFRPLLYPLKAGTDLGNIMFWPGEYGAQKAIAAMRDHGYAFTFDMPDPKGGTKQNGFMSKGMRELVDAVTSKDPMMKMSAINYDWNAREMMRQFNPSELNRWAQEKIFEKTGKNVELPAALHSAAAFLKMNVYMMERNADRQVRFPLWWHIYSEGRAKGVDEKDAILAATKHVNDKLGSAEELYHVGPQRGNELFKQIAPVISFAANQFGQWYEHGYRNGVMKSKIGKSAFAGAMMLSAASAAYYLYPSTLKWMINEVPQQDHKKSKERFFHDLNDESFQGVPVVGFLKHGLTTGNFNLPTLEFLADNTKAIHALKDIGHMTEKDWQKELDAFTEDFPLPTSLETPTMNFIDYMHHQSGGFGLKDFISKRKLPSEKKANSFFK